MPDLKIYTDPIGNKFVSPFTLEELKEKPEAYISVCSLFLESKEKIRILPAASNHEMQPFMIDLLTRYAEKKLVEYARLSDFCSSPDPLLE